MEKTRTSEIENESIIEVVTLSTQPTQSSFFYILSKKFKDISPHEFIIHGCFQTFYYNKNISNHVLQDFPHQYVNLSM